MSEIICPENYIVLRREPGKWIHIAGKNFYNPYGKDISLDGILARYGLKRAELFRELFKVNAGKLGYYIADVKKRNNYYCGVDKIDIKVKFLSLGIGRITVDAN